MHPSVPRLFCLGFDGLTIPPYLRRWLESGLGGVILFRRNLRDPHQLKQLTSSLTASASATLLIGVDQEGGRVTRLPEPFLQLPPAATLGLLDDPEVVRRLCRAVGVELRAAGFNWNLAPVLDLWTNPANTVIGDRAFGREPERVGRLALAAIQGYREAGILPTAKHFPGHGETVADSHHALPESPQRSERWRSVEFVPFRLAVAEGIPMVMVAHLLCPALDPIAPSSLSRRIVTGILREELGFRGVVISDDLEMHAITGTLDIGEAAVRFLEAGGDMILVCEREERQVAALAAVWHAVQTGRIPLSRLEESLERISILSQCRHLGESKVLDGVIGSPEHRGLLAEALASIGQHK
ncbi:MAG: beta-N-acetylhexosaminidase [candidate division NC10 bacterium]|nr:beta-N-acetylhexosaminidase [candidate division NC10 bacterium]